MDTRYEILESLPTYGPMFIPVTGDDEPYYSQGFAVRFYRDDKSDWVANFKPGWTGLNAIYEFDNQQNVLVIAGGTCYIMNPNDTKPIEVFGVVTISDWINFLFSRGSIFTTVAPILLIMAGIIVLYMTFIRSLIVAIETSSNTYKPRIKEIQKSEQVEDLISFLEHKNLKIYKHY